MGSDDDLASLREQALGGPVLGYRVLQLIDELATARARLAELDASETRTEWAVAGDNPEEPDNYGTDVEQAVVAARQAARPLVTRRVRTTATPWVPVEDEAGA